MIHLSINDRWKVKDSRQLLQVDMLLIKFTPESHQMLQAVGINKADKMKYNSTIKMWTDLKMDRS